MIPHQKQIKKTKKGTLTLVAFVIQINTRLPFIYTFLTPEQTQASTQLVIRQIFGNGDMIIPANMEDGYYTAASSNKLPYDDILKVYHDKRGPISMRSSKNLATVFAEMYCRIILPE